MGGAWAAAAMGLALMACNEPRDGGEPRPAALAAATEERLLAPGLTAGDWLGRSVAIDGDTLVAGAHGDDTRGTDAGAAYVFVRRTSGWRMQDKLLASDGGDTDYFGWAVDVSGNTIVVGARRDADRGVDFGSAYVFVRRGGVWTEQQKLYASDGAPGDRFGWSVSVDGDRALVGAVTHDGPAMDSGAAYVFVRSASRWTEERRLVASDGTGGDFLGQYVDLDGSTALVGADEDNVGGVDSGSAYVFVRSGSSWGEQAKLAPADGNAEDFFANGVALDGDTALLGAWGRDDRGTEGGGAYVFVRTGTTWTEQAKLLAPDGRAGDRLGRAVALEGDVALLGAYLTDDGGRDAGAAYVFTRSAGRWTMRSKSIASDASPGAQLGFSVALGGSAVLGAPFDPARASTAGAVYLYDLRSGDVDAGSVDAGSVDAGRLDAGSGSDAAAGAAADSAVLDPVADAGAGADEEAGAGNATIPPPEAAPTRAGRSVPAEPASDAVLEGGCAAAASGAGPGQTPESVIFTVLALLLARRRGGK